MLVLISPIHVSFIHCLKREEKLSHYVAMVATFLDLKKSKKPLEKVNSHFFKLYALI